MIGYYYSSFILLHACVTPLVQQIATSHNAEPWGYSVPTEKEVLGPLCMLDQS